MRLKSIIHSRRLIQISATVALIGLLIYGVVGRARTPVAGPSPTPDTPWKSEGQVKVRSSLSQTKVLQGSDGLVYLQVDLEAPDGGSRTGDRKPTDFVIVLDRSGSMADARKIEYAKRAVESLINQLREGDRFSLVTFDSEIETPIPLTPATTSSKRGFVSRLSEVSPRGSTNLGGGLMAGIQIIKGGNAPMGGIGVENRDSPPDSSRASGSAGARRTAQRLVLLSDGLANEGITNPSELNRIAARAVAGEFAISTIGVGLDFNESLMASLSDYGRGNYTFLEDLASLDKVLAQEFYGASRVHARDLAVRLDLDPRIQVVDASGYPLEESGNVVTFRPGQLYRGQKKSFFITLRLPTDTTYTRSLGETSLSYFVKDRSHRISLFGSDLKIACLPQEKKREVISSIIPGVFKEAWTKNNYGNLLKANADRIRAGDEAGALSTIQAYKAGLSAAYKAAPAPEMKKQLEELDDLEGQVKDAFTGPDAATKAKRLSKGYQYQGIQQQRKSN